MATKTDFLELVKPELTDFADVEDFNDNMDIIDAAIKSLTKTDISSATVTLSGTLTYTGSARTKTVSSVVLDGTTLTAGTDYVVSGNSATNAGTYSLAITGTGNYTGTIVKSWEIAKATGAVSVSSSSVSVVGAVGQTSTVTVTRSGDGVVSVISSNTSVVTATVSGTTITLTAQGSGSATVTVNVSTGTNYKAASCTFTVTASVFDSTLNNNSWEQIHAASQAEIGSSIWSVGATKAVGVNGTVGTLSINETLWTFIIDFNHNSAYEGTKKIHFQGFKTAQADGTDVGLVDSGYGSSYISGVKYFNMNHWGNYNYGGWAACDLRYDVLGSTNVAPSNYGSARSSGDTGYDATSTCATSPVSGTLMAALDSDLRAVMQPITKYTDNVAGATNVASNVSATVDYLPLLSEYEIFGSRAYGNSYEQNYQTQYAYYANGNSKIKYKHSDTATAAYWWSRSAYYNYTSYFVSVYTSGAVVDSSAYISRALAPAFAV